MPNEKYSNSSLTPKKFWARAGILLAVSVWMFTLGILVGRGTAPVKFDIHNLEQTLLDKRQAEAEKEVAATSKDIQSGPRKTELGFYKALKSAKTDDQLSGISSKPKTEMTPRQRPENNGASPQTRSTAGLYTVQVASLRSKDSAQRIANELIKKGYDAFFASSSSSGAGTWYRVRIGNYKNKSDANNMARLMKKESFQPIVVRRK